LQQLFLNDFWRCAISNSHFDLERGCVVSTSRSTPRKTRLMFVFMRCGRASPQPRSAKMKTAAARFQGH
jgi:hypothetical protein